MAAPPRALVMADLRGSGYDWHATCTVESTIFSVDSGTVFAGSNPFRIALLAKSVKEMPDGGLLICRPDGFLIPTPTGYCFPASVQGIMSIYN